ncbi:MAG: DUF6788 family protein [Pseudonocardiaceae bacterium]
MTPPTSDEQQQHNALIQQITRIGFCLPGTLTERHTRCSSPGCRCRQDPPALHGPYHSWTRKIAGTTLTRTLTADQARHYQPWFANARQLRALSAEIEALSLQIASRTERWGEK